MFTLNIAKNMFFNALFFNILIYSFPFNISQVKFVLQILFYFLYISICFTLEYKILIQCFSLFSYNIKCKISLLLSKKQISLKRISLRYQKNLANYINIIYIWCFALSPDKITQILNIKNKQITSSLKFYHLEPLKNSSSLFKAISLTLNTHRPIISRFSSIYLL